MRTLFSFRTLRKHYEVMPIVAIAAAHWSGAASIGMWMLYSKPDVRVIKSRKERFKLLDIDKPQTCRLFQEEEYSHEYPKEMDDLRRELWGVK